MSVKHVLPEDGASSLHVQSSAEYSSPTEPDLTVLVTSDDLHDSNKRIISCTSDLTKTFLQLIGLLNSISICSLYKTVYWTEKCF